MQSTKALVGAAILAVILLASGAVTFSGGVFAQPFDPSTLGSHVPPGVNAENSVAVGGGNATLQYYTFNPATIQINSGESVTWYSPTELNEFHTVTFARNQSLISDIILPFSTGELSPALANDLEPLPPFNLGEPILLDMQGSIAIVAVNKLAFYPSVTDSGGETAQYFEETDIQYQMNGSEGALNSGIIQQPPLQGSEMLPDGGSTSDQTAPGEQSGPPFPFVNSFTVAFEEAGTYDYFCALHPWMTGQVIVSDSVTVEESSPFESDLADDNDDDRSRSIIEDNEEEVAPTPSEDEEEDDDNQTIENGSNGANDDQPESSTTREEEEEEDDSEGCDPAYPDACIESPPPDLDCGDVSEENFTVREPDPHGFDSDNDGIGCES